MKWIFTYGFVGGFGLMTFLQYATVDKPAAIVGICFFLIAPIMAWTDVWLTEVRRRGRWKK